MSPLNIDTLPFSLTIEVTEIGQLLGLHELVSKHVMDGRVSPEARMVARDIETAIRNSGVVQFSVLDNSERA